jgi:hypothetical protein
VPDSSPQTVADFADAPEHAPALGKGAAMLGGWREEGHDYLDVTQRFPAHVEGHQAAREATLNRDQMAYFDRSNFTSGYNPWHGANNFGGMTAPEQSPEQVRNWTTAVGERKGRSRRVAWTDDDRKTHVNERAVRNPGSFS